jgi:hypothetical protein
MNNLLLFLAGFFLLFSYYRLSINTSFVNELWGNIDGELKNFYMISIFISAIPFIATLYYINTKTNINSKIIDKIYFGLLSIVLFSIFWMPLSILYLLKKQDKNMIMYLVLLTLFLVALSTLFVVYQLYLINDQSLLYNISFYGMLYFLFHTFVLDFITWSYNFFV